MFDSMKLNCAKSHICCIQQLQTSLRALMFPNHLRNTCKQHLTVVTNFLKCFIVLGSLLLKFSLSWDSITGGSSWLLLHRRLSQPAYLHYQQTQGSCNLWRWFHTKPGRAWHNIHSCTVSAFSAQAQSSSYKAGFQIWVWLTGWNRDAADMIMMENEPLHKQRNIWWGQQVLICWTANVC